MARKEFDSVICRLPFLQQVFYSNWQMTPMEIENLQVDQGIKRIILGISKPGFVFRYLPEKKKGFEKLAASMLNVFEENGILEEGDSFKKFYKENFLEFDFEIHTRMLCLLDFCGEKLTDVGGKNFVDALLSVGEEKNYFELVGRSKFIKNILFWNPFGGEDDRLEKWLELFNSQS